MKQSVQLFILVLMLGCSRPKVDYLGPAYISAPEGFTITTPFSASPSPSVDLTVGSGLTFTAVFSQTVTWVITIQGAQSAAVYHLTGTSTSLNNVTWNGCNDGVDFFRAGENVIATLSFYGTELTSSTTILITKVQNYTTASNVVFPKRGDFESTLQGWSTYAALIVPTSISVGTDSAIIDYTGHKVPSVQGKKYFYLRGLGDQSVFVTGLQYAWSVPSILAPLPPEPDNVWFNVYLYGTGDPNASVDIEMQEADFDGTTSGYQGTDDDAFVAHLTIDHKGWKLFSYRYSDLIPSTNFGNGASGNKIYEPARLSKFDIVLLKKSDPNSPIEVYIDYPIFTVGGPFKPCK